MCTMDLNLSGSNAPRQARPQRISVWGGRSVTTTATARIGTSECANTPAAGMRYTHTPTASTTATYIIASGAAPSSGESCGCVKQHLAVRAWLRDTSVKIQFSLSKPPPLTPPLKHRPACNAKLAFDTQTYAR
jgi:hypothetical protein